MTLILMFSLAATFAVTTPVVAGTQKWSEITMPGEKMQLLPGSDISTIAVTPDGKTLFAGVVVNQSWETDGSINNSGDWSLCKSTDGGYQWKIVSGYSDLGYSDEQIVAIKFSPDWATDGRIYVATNDSYGGYVYMSKDSGTKWTEIDDGDFSPISSMDVALDENDDVTIVVGDEDDVWLYSDGEWTAQNAGGAALAVAFSPDYATDGIIVAVVCMASDGSLRLRAETDIAANNWGKYMRDAYFTDKYFAPIPAVTACMAFPSDFSSTSSIFVGLNTDNGSTGVGLGATPTGQKGDAFKVTLSSGMMVTSGVTDLNMRGTDTATDVWSIAVSGAASSANIVCGLRYASQSSAMGNWQAQVHMSTNGGDSWSISMKPASGMGADTYIPQIGICAPVVVMAPDFATSEIVYCANGYYRGSGGLVLSGFYASTDQGATFNGRGLLDRCMGAITDITPSPEYGNTSTMYMVTADNENIVVPVSIGLLWKTVDGGAKWEIICDMLPLASVVSDLSAVCIDKVAIAGDVVFIAGVNDAIGMYPVPFTIFRSNDAGVTFPATISTYGPVEHMLAIDRDTLITANGSNIWKTTNSGAKWIKSGGKENGILTESEIESTETITDLALNGNTIIASTDAGNVYICTDYTADFSFLQLGKQLATAGFDEALVAFDAQYATNKLVYSTITWNASKGIYRIDSATSTDGTKWDTLNTSVLYKGNVSACSNFTSIACDNSGILWAICDVTNSGNTSDIATGVAIRSVNPTATTLSSVKFELVLEGLEANVDVLAGNLRIASSYIFAVGGTDSTKLFTYTDTLVKVTLVSPANGQAAAGDLLKGTSNARVILQWADITAADTYQYQVALDSAFEGIVSQSSTIAGTQVEVNLYAGTKYYWRVRVASGVNSQWSEIWSFTTPLGPSAEAPILLSPTAGQDGVILLPVLQWSGLAYATKYELQVAKGCDFSGSNLIVDKTGSNALVGMTAYPMTQSLAAGTSYCWKVRAVSDLSNSAWSNTGTFTTAPAPAPEPEPEGTPIYVWVIIALSAVLLVAVVILIIRTRRA